MYRRLAAVAAASAPAYFCLAPRLRFAFADTETPNLPKANTAKIVIEDDAETYRVLVAPCFHSDVHSDRFAGGAKRVIRIKDARGIGDNHTGR